MTQATATVEPIGREEAIRIVCEGLADGIPLREICRREGMPARRTVDSWREADPELAARIARAREIGFDEIADECSEIADDGTNDWIERQRKNGSTYIALNEEAVQRSRLRVDTRLKLLSKWSKKYADKQQLEHTGADGKPLNLAVLEPDAVVDQLVAVATEYPQAAPRLRKLLQAALDRMPV